MRYKTGKSVKLFLGEIKNLQNKILKMGVKVDFKLDDKHAQLPRKGTANSAAYDIYLVDDVTLGPLSVNQLDTGLVIENISPGYYIQILSRSSLALFKTLFTCGGVIDPDYEGRIKVLMYNGSLNPVSIKRGERIAQFIILPVTEMESSYPDAQPLKLNRGVGGFGSTNL